ncbi:hypothetical protein F7U66_01485 [Vibrio parahaemolyticus]|nr:hypothetical protein [Vibrio parahaemolyticus]
MSVNNRPSMVDVFGKSDPSNREVDEKFKSEGLSLSDFRGNVVDIGTTFHVMGQSETRSDNSHTAQKKSMLLCAQTV